VADSPVIVSGPGHSLTKQEIVDYYKDPLVQERLLQGVGNNPVLTVMQRTPGEPIYRRYDKKAPIFLSPAVLEELVRKRTVEFHPTIGTKSKELWVDLDPGESVSPDHLKQTVKHVEDVLKKIPGVASTNIVFSGGRGYHVRAELDKEQETNKLRERLQKSLRPLHESNPSLVHAPPKGNEIRLDTSTFHDQGSVRAPYSLNSATGLVALPVAREKLDMFQPKSDATIKSVLSKKDVGEFAPGIPRDRTTQALPTAEGKNWTLAIQKHIAEKAGPHWDLRLVDPETQQAHSWAVPKASFPEDKPRLALQMPTHSADYALSFGAKGPQRIHEGYGKGTVEIEHKEPVKVLTVSPDKVVFKRDSGDTFSMRRTHENKWLFRKAANMSDPSVFYQAGYQDTLAKLGASKGRSTGMRGEDLAYGEGHRPLESNDKHLPVGQLTNILQEMPNVRTQGGKTTLENKDGIGDNHAEWGPAMQIRIFDGASPYLAGRN